MKLKKRKWLSLLLCFALILSLMPTTALAANDVFSGGNGTQASPYEISDLATLEAFREYVNAGSGAGEYFKLTADIDMSEKYGADIGGSEISWTPIGIGNISFSGNFDGGGHTVSGLYINAPNSDKQGLFGFVGNSGTVQNLGVDGTVSGAWYVGGVVGRNFGTVTNCRNTGDVGGNYDVGGVVGSTYGAVTSCCNTGAVNGGNEAGGVVGYNLDTVTNCYNTGTVSGIASIGGVVGTNNGTVTNCYNTGTVSGSDCVGGVIGYNSLSGTATSCYYLTGTADGGIGGTADSSESADKVGSAEAKTAAEFAVQSTFVDWDFDGTWSMDNFHGRPVLPEVPEDDHISGSGTQTDPYLIRNLAMLEAFRDYVNEGSGAGEYFKLTADIDMSEKYGADIGGSEISWTPIGNNAKPFKGNFDGGEHTVSRLFINAPSSYYQGLFGVVDEGGAVQDLGVDGSVIGDYYVGGVVGENEGTVTNCRNTGTVSGRQNIGGVIGENFNGTVTDCRNTGTVSGIAPVGGVVGYNYGSMVTNCYNTGDVSGGEAVGGVIGENNGTVTSCRNTGTVRGNEDVGNSEYIGGVVGTNDDTVTNCYNTGDVSGSAYVGGVVGTNNDAMTNCYNTGKVSGGSSVGGVAGWSRGTETSCYYLTGTADGGIGGTAEIKAENVNIAEGYLLNVTLSECGFILETAEGAQLAYTVTKDGKAVNVSDTVLTVAGGVADNKGAAKLAFNLANGETVTYAGAYTGTVIFTVSVEEDVLTQDQDGVYRIRGAKSLAAFRDLVNSGQTDINAMLMNDIDLKGSETNQWTPIGNNAKHFKGNFDGGGHTISGLYINSTSDYQGLFGFVDRGGTVQNLGVDGTVSGSYYVGGVVGFSTYGTVTNCYNTGAVSGSYYVGGVVGWHDGTMTNCYNTGAISGSQNVGGVIGYNSLSGTATNCCYLTGTADGGIEGADAAGSAEAKTAEEFATQSTFVDWDFDTIWQMNGTLNRPTLRSNPENAS